MDIDINDIKQDTNQPRRYFDETLINELAKSLKLYGILQPIIVKEDNTEYIIIAGERRYRAAIIAGFTHIPCIIREKDSIAISIIENIQREQLSPIDEAVALKEYMRQNDITQSEAASQLSKSRSYIANRLRLLKLDKDTINALENNLISEGHAKTLLGIQKISDRDKIVKKILSEGLSVRQTEKMVRDSKKSTLNHMLIQSKKTTLDQNEDIDSQEIKSAEEELTEIFGTKVIINDSGSKGCIKIEYYSKDQLMDISDILFSLKDK